MHEYALDIFNMRDLIKEINNDASVNGYGVSNELMEKLENDVNNLLEFDEFKEYDNRCIRSATR
jgi:hypothetical protein